MSAPPPPLHLTWLVPDDRGGGVISVAQECCRQAVQAGHEATLILLLPPTDHSEKFGGYQIASLAAKPPHTHIPAKLTNWLKHNPQDILLLNGCEETDVAIPYIPSGIRLVYVVHDTADRYFKSALRYEAYLDAIIAVSETVAARFRHRLQNPGKLQIALNGTAFPISLSDVIVAPRDDDLVFIGGSNPVKGAHDVLALWTKLQGSHFTGKLHWFGHLDESFRNRISAVPAAERIVLHGRQPRPVIFEAARRSKVVLMLSRVEPFGMVTVECMGMGCLAVAWDIATGTKEIVDEDGGIFVPLGDYDALAGGVLKALNLHRGSFAPSAKRVRNHFSEAAMWARYEAAFEALLQSPPAPRPSAGKNPPSYRPPLRLYQWTPASLRSKIRTLVGKSPRLGYALRDFRGR